MDESSFPVGDDDAILNAADDGDCLDRLNPLLDIVVDRRKNAVDVSNTENLAAVRKNNGREIIIVLHN